jgi:DNA-binding transcriptional LysR family regulator
MMDLRLLRTFVAAYEEASFSKAAERLNSTQPGVSNQIAALEAEFGVPLFERRGRGVHPTIAGKKLHARATRILLDVNSTSQEMRALGGAIMGQAAVGIPPTLSKAVLAPVLARFVEAHPEVELRVFEAYSDTLLSLVESGTLDFALVARLPDHPAITYEKAYRDQFVLASGPKLKLPPGATVALDRRPYFKLIVPSLLRGGLQRLLEEPLRTGRIVPARFMEIDGLIGALQFVVRTDWAALLPAAAVRQDGSFPELRVNRIASEDIAIDYFIARAAIRPMTPASTAFVSMMLEELASISH